MGRLTSGFSGGSFGWQFKAAEEMCERVPRGKDRVVGEGVAPRREPHVDSKAGQHECALDSTGAVSNSDISNEFSTR